ncbi:MAG: cyclic nucleotide-binding domain-containing protein [Bdellovibrionaceae bacterium]|nr:cyclic nucleotide-binding domain-containing protein [Pseudobdellovibrionaceae bacterium]
MNQKVYKKGDILFKESDKITHVIFVQSGGVNVCLQRGKKNLDLYQVSTQSILGESFFNGQATHPYTAIATTETKTLEVPLEALKAQFEAGPQLFKMAIKSLTDRLKISLMEMKSSRLEKDSSPCPEDLVAKVFGSIFHTIKHKGSKRKDGYMEIDWLMLRQYSQRIFSESFKRLEQACNILVKLKLANYEVGKAPDNPDGPDEIQKFIVYDLLPIESFFEFYQYYYFKYGKNEILKPDDFTISIVDALLKFAAGKEIDRFGIVSLDFTELLDFVKNEVGIQLNNDHFSRLEQKGCMTKRRTIADVVKLEFEIKELKNILFTWKVLKEIEKWNERGSVDINEKEEKKAKKSENQCPQCAAPVTLQQKFCAECGHALVQNKAS